MHRSINFLCGHSIRQVTRKVIYLYMVKFVVCSVECVLVHACVYTCGYVFPSLSYYYNMSLHVHTLCIFQLFIYLDDPHIETITIDSKVLTF